MRLPLRIPLIAAAALVCFHLSGCMTAMVATGAAGSVAYVRGALQTRLSHPIGAVSKATEAAIRELKLARVSGSVDGVSGEYLLRTASDEKVQINLKTAGVDATEVQIRVGLFGDQEISQRVLAAIQEEL